VKSKLIQELGEKEKTKTR